MLHHFPGCIKNSIIPPKITRIMVGAFDVERIADFDIFGENQFKQKGRIMLDRICSSLGGIFVFQSIIGMGIRGQDMLEFATLQGLNVVLCKRIEERVRGLEGVRRVRSTAAEGMGVVSVEFERGIDISKLLEDIKNEVDRIATFPAETEQPESEKKKKMSQ